MKCVDSYTSKYVNNQGFTLVELVAVMVILGILAVYVAPRMFDKSDIAAYSLKNRAISIFRNMQVRAMQDTRSTSGFCYQVVVDSSNTRLGTPALNFSSSGSASDSCGSTIDTSDSGSFYYIPTTEFDEGNVTVSASNSEGASLGAIRFNSKGQPIPITFDGSDAEITGTCNSGCTLNFAGVDSATVCFESEGYIYAC